MEDNPSSFKDKDRPVERVSWHEANAFIDKLNQHFQGQAFSLPSEAQWEYACRAGTQTHTYAGDLDLTQSTSELLDRMAWYNSNANGETQPVGQKEANPWGLFDMLGNVWEWCQDNPREYQEMPEVNPIGSDKPDGQRVLRGGSWFYLACHLRAAQRFADGPGIRSSHIGFRCALVQQR